MFNMCFYLFIFIQVNPTMLLGDLRKLDTNIAVRLPVKMTEDMSEEEEGWVKCCKAYG